MFAKIASKSFLPALRRLPLSLASPLAWVAVLVRPQKLPGQPLRLAGNRENPGCSWSTGVASVRPGASGA